MSDCLFVVYISILTRGKKVVVGFIFSIVMGNDGFSFQLGPGRYGLLGFFLLPFPFVICFIILVSLGFPT